MVQSLGRATSPEEVLALAPPGVRRLHVFERDRFRPGEEPPDADLGREAAV